MAGVGENIEGLLRSLVAGAGENIDGLLSSLFSNLRAMEERLKCLICKQLLQKPTLMTCDHYFCKECIPKYMVSLCPICKARFVSKNLRPALYIEEMLLIYQEMEASKKYINSCWVSAVGGLTGESQSIPIPQIIKRGNGSQMSNSCRQDSTQRGIAVAPTGDREVIPISLGIEKRANEADTKDSSPVPSTKCSTSQNKRTERKQLAGSSLKRLKLTFSRVPVGLYEDECIFCHSFRRNLPDLGELLIIQDGKVVSRPDKASNARVLYAHEYCLDWAPEIYYQDKQIINLESVIERASQLKCAKCGLNGAALGCYYELCRKSYHPYCAYQVRGCRWDTEYFNMLCPDHATEKLMCDSDSTQSDTAVNENGCRPARREWSNQLGQEVHRQKSKQNALIQSDTHELSKGKVFVLLGLQLSQAEKEMLVQFSKRFSAILTKKWRNDVTHVVISTCDKQAFGELRHAHEALMAILHGTWIVKIEWIKASLEREGHVPEELYELNQDFYGSLGGPRKGRMRATAPKALNLFANFGFLLSKDLPPGTKCRLKELLVAGGGEVLEQGTTLLESDSDRRRLPTYLVYNEELPQKLGSSRRIEQLKKLAKRMRCSRLVSHKRVAEAIVNCDAEILNMG